MVEIKRKSTLKTIGMSIFAFLAIYFIVSIYGNRNSYQKEINALNQEKNVLLERLEDSVSKDSILYYTDQQEAYKDGVEILNKKLEELKKRYDEKNDIDIYNLPLDSNIIILSKFLSEEDSYRKRYDSSYNSDSIKTDK